MLVTSLQSHQRCFAVEDQQGQLLPCFVLVSNIVSTQPELVIRGNERVVTRLADADFFYNNDIKQTLASRSKKQETVLFQKGLASADKSKRLVKLVNAL